MVEKDNLPIEAIVTILLEDYAHGKKGTAFISGQPDYAWGRNVALFASGAEIVTFRSITYKRGSDRAYIQSDGKFIREIIYKQT
ncbi:MAG: hypothetical protein WC916_00530 [Candidatus Woesearchaeota archaeon]